MDSDVQWNVPSTDHLSEGHPAVLDPLLDDLATNDYTSPGFGSSSSMPLPSQSMTTSMSSSMMHHLHQESLLPSSSLGDTMQHQAVPISITDPRKESEGTQGAYVSYCIQSNNTNVRRRFQDFVWLYNVLYAHFPACFVPPLPDKHRLEYVKGDRFSKEFIEQRRASLERFLQRISRHPILSQSEHFIMFLSSSQFNDASAKALREAQETMIDTISDSLLNAFVKIREPDQRFVEIKDRVDRLVENLDMLEKTLSRAHKRTEDLAQDYDEFAASIRGLADMETGMRDALLAFADGTNSYAQHMNTLVAQDVSWVGEIHDYIAYYNAMKGVLKLRDQKQLDVDDLSEYLQNYSRDREKTMHSQGSGSYGNLAGFLSGKINEARGADMDKLRREKVLKLDSRIRELKDAVEQASSVSEAFSNHVLKEDSFFTQSKAKEMQQVLQSYTDAKVEFYHQGAAVWREVVDALEQNTPR